MLIEMGSALWSCVNQLVRFWFHWGVQRGFFKPARFGARVVSVGNIQVGGAGKTPLVAHIARQGAERGLEVWILTRGYRSLWEKTGGLLGPQSSIVSPAQCGDEAALLHELCPQAWIGVGRDRVSQYQSLRQERGRDPDLVVLDDAFQNFQMIKDLEIVALTAARPRDVLFREGMRALERADLLVWTKGEILGEFRPILEHKPWVHIQYELSPARSDATLWLWTGVADGESVERLARQSGYRVVKHSVVRDHFRYSKDQVLSVLAEARGLGLQIALTGKDWVKWKQFGVPQESVVVLEPQIQWIQGESVWQEFVWGE